MQRPSTASQGPARRDARSYRRTTSRVSWTAMDGRAIGNGESPAHWSGNDNADSDINVLVVLDTSTTQAMR